MGDFAAARQNRTMDSRRLAELRADRDLFARFLADWEEQQARASQEDAVREGVLEYMDHLKRTIADLDAQIAALEAEG
jgi:hypothetical protein